MEERIIGDPSSIIFTEVTANIPLFNNNPNTIWGDSILFKSLPKLYFSQTYFLLLILLELYELSTPTKLAFFLSSEYVVFIPA